MLYFTLSLVHGLSPVFHFLLDPSSNKKKKNFYKQQQQQKNYSFQQISYFSFWLLDYEIHLVLQIQSHYKD